MVLEELSLENDSSINHKFLYGCDHYAASASDYKTFGWKFTDLEGLESNIVDGLYELKVYWATDRALDTSLMEMNSEYQLRSNGTIQVDVQMPELPDTQLVTVDLKEGANGQKLALAKGNSYDFVFGTSVEAGTPIRVFYRQCTTGEDGDSKCTDFAPNDDGKQYHFNTTEDKTQIHRIAVPKNESFVVDESLTDSTVTTSLWMVATLCGEDRFSHKQFMVCFTCRGSWHHFSEMSAFLVLLMFFEVFST